jgi:hypothetical protein
MPVPPLKSACQESLCNAKCNAMEPNSAAEHLQVIRTLMERSALYRRALAPIMAYCGVLGIIAGILGNQLKLESSRAFLLFWGTTAGLALLGSLLLVRRQALKDSEPFWSPPTRRVAQALLPPFVVALFFSAFALDPEKALSSPLFLVQLWVTLYGCALHSAGFFISRGFQMLGWLFCITGFGLFLCMWCWRTYELSPNLLMGALFGGLHLAAGIYLYFTEKRKNAA